MKFQGRTSRGNSRLRCWVLGLLDSLFFYPWSARTLPGDTVVEVWLSWIRKHSYSWNIFVLCSKPNFKVTTVRHANSQCIFIVPALTDLYLALRCLSFLFTKEQGSKWILTLIFLYCCFFDMRSLGFFPVLLQCTWKLLLVLLKLLIQMSELFLCPGDHCLPTGIGSRSVM